MGLWSTLGRIGKTAAGFIPGGGPVADLIGLGVSTLPGLLRSGESARGGAPKPGFDIRRPQYTFENPDGGPINTRAVSEGTRADIAGTNEAIRRATEANTQTAANLEEFGTGMGTRAGSLLDQGQGDLGAAGGYYRKILEGDAAATAEALSPELNAAAQARQNALDQISEFAPRGGGAGRAALATRIAGAGDVARIISTARPMAAEGLTRTGATAGDLGLGAGSLSVNAGEAGAGIRTRDASLAGEGARLGLSADEIDANNATNINRLLLERESDENRILLGQADLGQRARQTASDSAGALGTGIANILGAIGRVRDAARAGRSAQVTPVSTGARPSAATYGMQQSLGSGTHAFSTGSGIGNQYDGARHAATRRAATA